MAENGVLVPEKVMPEKWKPWPFSKERYCNPAHWNFSILKRTSFSASMMGNMFSKYWSQPQMKDDRQDDGERETKDEKAENFTLIDGEEFVEPQMKDDRQDDGEKETKDEKAESSTLIDGEEMVELQSETDGTNNKQKAVTEKPCDQNESGGVEEARKNPEELTDREIRDLKEPPRGQIKILWIGHASLLIQMEGKNILTDPIFSSKAGPRSTIGYSRYRKPAVTVKELKGLKDFKIDAVVISHNHYDHFDKQSVRDLNSAFPSIKWFVPMKLEPDLTSLGCKNVKEATWWQSSKFDEGITFHFTPAKHWSGRSPTDWYTSLWGSWVIEGKTAKVYFAGDTGFQKEIFEAIQHTFDPITVAALPIGAYEPRDMMECQHINPEEAVKIHQILKVQKSIGIHWRTFQLSCEGIDQPFDDLQKAKREQGVGKEDFITLEKSLFTTIDCKKQDST